MKTKEIDKIREVLRTKKDGLCVSIIVPLEKTLPERNKNEGEVKSAIKKAKAQLLANHDTEEVYELLDVIDGLHEEIDFARHAESIGLFVNLYTSQLLYFPFPVKEKIVIGGTFEVRDLLFTASRQINYWVLCLSNNFTRLLYGEGKALTEVIDTYFPLHYEEQFQNMESWYGNEESKVQSQRQHNYFRHVDKQLDLYLKQENLPVFLVGVERHHSIFGEATHHKEAVVASIMGNYDYSSPEELAHKVWPVVEDYIKKEEEKILVDIEEKTGSKRGFIYGIEVVWRAANEGRGEVLVVEKDFVHPAYRDAGTGRMFFNIQETAGLEKLEDIVDDTIEKVLEQGGDVIFLDNGKLEKFQRIALMTRY